MEKPCRVFCCYTREDQQFLHDLKKHLMPLQREGAIIVQADVDISPGIEWEREIDHHLEDADIILLLISPDFIASDYWFEKVKQKAIARHLQGTARVVPVIIRPTDWQGTPFGMLQALPKDDVPISSWRSRDDAFLSVTEGMRRIVQELTTNIRADQNKEETKRDLARENTPYKNMYEENHMNTNDNSGKYNIQNNGPIQSQVFGDHNRIYINGDQKDGISSLEKGAKALRNGDYPLAKKELRVAVEEIDGENQLGEAAKANYFLALALLGGKLPRTQGRAVIQSIEVLMNNAVRHPSLCILLSNICTYQKGFLGE